MPATSATSGSHRRRTSTAISECTLERSPTSAHCATWASAAGGAWRPICSSMPRTWSKALRTTPRPKTPGWAWEGPRPRTFSCPWVWVPRERWTGPGVEDWMGLRAALEVGMAEVLGPLHPRRGSLLPGWLCFLGLTWRRRRRRMRTTATLQRSITRTATPADRRCPDPPPPLPATPRPRPPPRRVDANPPS